MQVLVLNSDYSYLNLCNWKRAVILLHKGKVEVLEYTDKTVQNSSGSYKIKVPSVIKLISFIQGIYRSKVKFNKHNVLIRDNYTCSYCKTSEGKMNVDHIIPTSKNGKSSWENCCCSCIICNHKKADRTPKEAGMILHIQPKTPSIAQFLHCKKTLLSFELKY